MALMAKTDVNLIALDKGETSEEDIVKQLIHTMESYTNAGLNLIRDKINDNPNHFLNPTSFLEMILMNSKQEKSDNMEIDKDNVELIFSTNSDEDI
jgi:hypothetical protein